MLALSTKADLKPLQRGFVAFRSKQVPFATALALTSLAKGVEAQENEATVETFKNPTPFTRKSFAILPATKSKPVAIVFPKDIQEQYLAPYVLGGNRSLGSKRAMLVPISAGVNAYGNMPRNKLAQLKSKPNVFIGTVRFRKSGKAISGVWQRGETPRGKRYKGNDEYGTRGDSQGKVAGARTTLKLLIEFKDTTPAPEHLDFYGRANTYLRRNAAREFDVAMRKALATARR